MSAGEISPVTVLTKYNNNIPLTEQTAAEEITTSVAMGGVMVGGFKALGKTWQAGKFMMHPVRNTSNWWANYKSDWGVRRQIMQNNPLGPVRSREYSAYKKLKQMKTELPRATKGGPVSAQYRATQSIIDTELTNTSGKGYAQGLRQAQLSRNAADFAKYRQKVAYQNRTGSVTRMLKNKTGLTRLSTASREMATKSVKYGKFIKGVKGNAAAAVIFGGISIVTEVIPAFRVSNTAGFKQLGKSAAKTGVDLAAFAAGSWAGAKIGAGIGAAIGSVVPGAGTGVGAAIGGVLGLVGGCIASYFADQKMEEIIGENEGDKELKERAEAEAKKAEQEQKNLELQFNRAIRKVSDSFFNANGDISQMDDDDFIVLGQAFGISPVNDSEEALENFNISLNYFIYANNPERYSKWLRNNSKNQAEAEELLRVFKETLDAEEAAKKRSEQVQARVEQSNEHYQGSTNYMDDRTKTERNPFNLNQPGQQLSLMA